MAVLKGILAGGMLGGAVAMDLADLRAEGMRLVAAARSESDRTLREARAEAARIRANAVEEGQAEGLAAGRALGIETGRTEGEAAARDEIRASFAERLAALDLAWTDAVGRWETSREALMREARQRTIQLGLGIAQRIVRRSIAADPLVAVAQLEAALELLGKATSMTVVCSVDDRGLLEQELPRILERLGAASDVTFSADAALSPGDVIVRVAEGSVDGRIATQLDRIADALMPGAGPVLGAGDRGTLIP